MTTKEKHDAKIQKCILAFNERMKQMGADCAILIWRNMTDPDEQLQVNHCASIEKMTYSLFHGVPQILGSVFPKSRRIKSFDAMIDMLQECKKQLDTSNEATQTTNAETISDSKGE